MSRAAGASLTISDARPHRLAFPALLLGNVALAFGPWLVRLSDVGPVAVGFWRLVLALPFLWLVALGCRAAAALARARAGAHRADRRNLLRA